MEYFLNLKLSWLAINENETEQATTEAVEATTETEETRPNETKFCFHFSMLSNENWTCKMFLSTSYWYGCLINIIMGL